MLGRNFFKWMIKVIGFSGSLDSMWPRRLIRLSSDPSDIKGFAFSAEKDVPSVLAASGSNAF